MYDHLIDRHGFTHFMIRIEQTDRGLYVVFSSGVSQYISSDGDELDKATRECFHLLRAADEGVYIPGIGRHLSGGVYWVEEGDDPCEFVSFTARALYIRDLRTR